MTKRKILNQVQDDEKRKQKIAQQQLVQQLWKMANTLSGSMDANDFKDYILGFIFYKYLSKKVHTYADMILSTDGILYKDIDNKVR